MVRDNTKSSIALSIGADSGKFVKHIKKGITKDEVKRRAGYIFLGVFAAYLIDPIHNYIDSLGINPVMFAVIGLVFTFYYFDF